MNKLEPGYNDPNKQLIMACRNGDSRAQAEVYKLYYKAMFNTCLRIVNNRLEAEDIMQEAFLQAFDKIKTFSENVAFGAWLKRIVINKSIDFLRRNKLEFVEFEPWHSGLVTEGSMLEEDQLFEESLAYENVKQAIEELPSGYKMVVNLYAIEELSHDEIAKTLGISASTSRSQYTRAKQKIIEYLKNKNK
jgi:RNA polymerase sigma factor (sigma-70 family)